MCCFAQPVEKVNRTRIFCRLSGHGTQYVTYQMDYKSEVPNAMILPLPTKRGVQEDAVRFIDLSGYDNFFKDLNKGFPPVARTAAAFAVASPASRGASLLAVQQVGDFVASYVPSIQDFERLDPRFVIPVEVWSKIPEYGDYGFAVFQLKSLEGKPHPMAFEFPTRFDDKIFFPTVHIHDGEVHEVEEYDHTLYLQDAALDERTGGYTGNSDPATTLVRSKDQARSFTALRKSQGIVRGDLLVHRRTLEGRLANTDFVVTPAAGDPHANSYKLYGMRSVAALATLIPVGWIIHRRNRVRSTTLEC